MTFALDPGALRLFQAAILADARSNRDVVELGPFVATFNPRDANPYLNYAVPLESAEPASAEVQELVAAYRGRKRRPRLEYIPAVAPAVEEALREEGFEQEGRLPLMTAGSLRRSRVPGIELVSPGTDEEFGAVASVQWEAYEEEPPVPQQVIDALKRTSELGGVVCLAREEATGEPAGAGLCVAPDHGCAELTSVGVRAAFRRRGIAEAMAAWLGQQAEGRGIEHVFLMARGARPRHESTNAPASTTAAKSFTSRRRKPAIAGGQAHLGPAPPPAG
jgi:ribosomal protein S18 acetylase RimI-like enzyme